MTGTHLGETTVMLDHDGNFVYETIHGIKPCPVISTDAGQWIIVGCHRISKEALQKAALRYAGAKITIESPEHFKRVTGNDYKPTPPEFQQGSPDKYGLVSRIDNYLQAGGLFNPEMMEHDKVRQLLMDCRDAIDPTPKPRYRVILEPMSKRLGLED